MAAVQPHLPQARRIRVTGRVQGVGFRPTVWRLARECGLAGDVRNDAGGVLIHAWGSSQALDIFMARLRDEAPPLAHIESIEAQTIATGAAPAAFTIAGSEGGMVRTGVVADAATCPACRADILDPSNRRYRYPFTNCTHCGPRLSIIRAVPWDRATTSMSAFALCADCQAEYHDPGDRRFHAQPNACPACGPRAWLEDAAGAPVEVDGARDAVDAARRLIADGHIVAVKGLGGIHLACDAGNARTVASLRQRKRRYRKAFALMARDTEMVRRYAHVGAAEQELLESRAAPIVVLDALPGVLPEELAPGQHTLGFMLPYTPLHHLLMRDMERPVVLTSGNLSDEPQCIDNADAASRLCAVADFRLLHDRDIVNRLDDSVARVVDGAPQVLRRARGYAPEGLPLPPGFGDSAPVLAMGAELKNTFCLLKEGEAILSQHMGDLEEAATLADYHRHLELYRDLFRFTPSRIAIDRHPDYLSTQAGRRQAADEGLPLDEVQHHHAHVAACMGEHGLAIDTPPVLGVALDGLGLGEGGALWGGEFLLADYRGFRRLAHFTPVTMPGGTRAMREPWRNTYAHLSAFLGWTPVRERYAGLPIVRFLAAQPLDTLDTMIARGLNSPLSSSAGRLFDAVAAALGVCREHAVHEGQAAMELEALAARAFAREAGRGYANELVDAAGVTRLDWSPLWRELLDDLLRGTGRATVAARFHQGLVQALDVLVERLAREYGVATVVLAGGVFQNRLLLEGLVARCRSRGLRVLYPQRVPVNDGGISLGQALVAAARAAAPRAGKGGGE